MKLSIDTNIIDVIKESAMKNNKFDISAETVKDGLSLLDKEDSGRKIGLWLKVLAAETEEELTELKELGLSSMVEALAVYRTLTSSPEFLRAEHIDSKARHDEAQALKNAERKRDEHWQEIIDKKDAEISAIDAVISDKEAEIAKLLEALKEK